ncbi:GumC family protein [Pontibacter chitinilyticus]|uniref:GumC family protein n=1 Tax=Pontibacter chitinilyticus TaxID=2674989 RepID=UPI00321A8CBA
MEKNTIEQQDAGLDIKRLLHKVLLYWYWIVASVAVALLIAFLVNRYTIPQYQVTSSVMINQPVEDGASAAALLYGTEVFQGSKDLTDESILIKTKALVLRTLDKLHFDVTYYQQGNVKLTEVYGAASPIQLSYDTAATVKPYGVLFKVTVLDQDNYQISTENPGWNAPFDGKKFTFGKVYTVNGFTFSFSSRIQDASEVNNELLFRVNDLKGVAGQYAAALSISPYPGGASALVLNITGPTPAKEIDFLNAHMQTYQQQNLAIKNKNGSNTINFIDEQLQQISDSLAFVEGRLETFKKSNSTLDLSSDGSKTAQELKALEDTKATLLVNDKYYQYLHTYLQQGKEQEQVVAPANLGISDPVLNGLIGQLVTIQGELAVLSQNDNKANPIISNELKVKRQQLSELRSSLQENLSSLETANNIALRDLNSRIATAAGKLQALPTAERKLINIERLHNLSENLYVFLMEKRAEAGIAMAANTSDVTILSEAVRSAQTAPASNKNYLIGLILGLAIPVSLIFLKDFFNNKVSTVEELKRFTSLPLLGMIGHNKNEQSSLIDQSPKSALSEAFRTVRSNLRFMTNAQLKTGKIFVITSSISGEGKTFSAKNLAYIFAISGERTLLVNADMRKPNNNTDFGVSSSLGLSNYLAGYATLEEVVHHTLQENLHILPSGDIPPNPSELLLNRRMEELVAELKQRYDYIIMDTPPVGLLSDGMELMQLADANIFMVRQGYSLKSFLTNIQQQYETGKIRNTAILFNDVDFAKLNYGYGYGYGYGYYAEDVQQKLWWKRWM